MYSKAWEGRPPLHPWLSKSPAQSTSCCSEKVISFPFLKRFQCASMHPIVEKAQQDPQDPWFLTGVTTPKLFHSQLSGIALALTYSFTRYLLVAEQFWGAINLSCLNSSKVESEKSLIPCFHECLPMLWFLISLMVCMKMLNLYSDGECSLLNCWQISLTFSMSKTPSPFRKSLYFTFR